MSEVFEALGFLTFVVLIGFSLHLLGRLAKRARAWNRSRRRGLRKWSRRTGFRFRLGLRLLLPFIDHRYRTLKHNVAAIQENIEGVQDGTWTAYRLFPDDDREVRRLVDQRQNIEYMLIEMLNWVRLDAAPKLKRPLEPIFEDDVD